MLQTKTLLKLSTDEKERIIDQTLTENQKSIYLQNKKRHNIAFLLSLCLCQIITYEQNKEKAL